MVYIQSATAEIRRGKKKKIEEDRRNHRAKNIMSASAMQGGHNNQKYVNVVACIHSGKRNVFILLLRTLAMTLTFELDLDRINMNQGAKYLGQR